MAPSLRPSTTIALASSGALLLGFCAYAVYFDHKRRTDPEFRKALQKESRKEARAAKEQLKVQGIQRKQAIRAAVRRAQETEFPTDPGDKEIFFMTEVGRGEGLCQDDEVEAALCFYKALKVYPDPRDLIPIYEKTVPKPVLEVLAEMFGLD